MSNPKRRLPSAIKHKLRSVQRRKIALTTMRGIAIGLGMLSLGLICAMTIDWLWVLFSPAARTILTCATVAISIGGALTALISRLSSNADISHVARCVDSQVPNLEQRWGTVTTFSHSGDSSTTDREQSMQDQVASEAVAMHSLVTPSKLAPLSLLGRPMIGLVGCVLALVAFMAIYPQQTRVLWNRFWSPTQDITATQLTNETDLVLIPRGERINLAVRQHGVPRSKAEFTLEYASGLLETIEVQAGADDAMQFVHTLSAGESIRYQMRAGDGQTQWQTLEVIDFPEIGEVQFKIVSPNYVKRAVVEKKFIPRRIKVIQGSTLLMAVRPQTPVQRLMIETTSHTSIKSNESSDPPQQSEQVELDVDAGGWYYFEQSLQDDVLVELKLWSEHGLTNQGRTTCRIETIQDAAPVARVIDSNDETVVADDEVIEIKFEAYDDIGIAKAELVIYDDSQLDENGRPTILQTRQIPMGDQALTKHWVGETTLDLKELLLPNDAQISYAIRVTDNRDADVLNPSQTDSSETDSRDNQTGDNNSSETASNSPSSQTLDPDVDRPRPSEAELQTSQKHSESGVVSIDSKDRPTDSSTFPQEPQKSIAPAGESSQPNESKLAKQSGPSGDGSDPEPQPTHNLSQYKSRNESQKNSPEAPPQPINSTQVVTEASSTTNKRRSSSMSGQNTESVRRRLRITKRLESIAKNETIREQPDIEMRDRIKRIDEQLATSQSTLQSLVDHSLPDSSRGKTLAELDTQMGTLQDGITKMRSETRSSEFSFVGLQMVDLSRFQITPARDRVFAAKRRPGACDRDVRVALGHVTRARLRLAKLTKRYDRVVQDRDLQKSLDKSITLYEVYAEKSHVLLREASRNRNPMTRKMAIHEIDQGYLDRLTEVLRLRREMMNEFSEMLGDDPRLMSRYMDLIRRREDSLRDRMSELAERQDEATIEMQGWLEVDEQQRGDLWTIVTELRLGVAEQLARDVASFADRVIRRMPLVADADRGMPARIILHADAMTQAAQLLAIDSGKLLENPTPQQVAKLQKSSDELVVLCNMMEAYLNQLQISKDGVEEIDDYIGPRLLQNRALAATAESWSVTVHHLSRGKYSPIASLEQHALAIDTEVLRVDMLNIEAGLQQQFRRRDVDEIPEEVTELLERVQQLMDLITMNQVAATIAASQDDLKKAARQQQDAMTRFNEAEHVFDQMRRAVADAFDAIDEPDLNVADLRDPTLDEFRARLEREPNINERLGLSPRRKNLRVNADSMLWEQQCSGLLTSSRGAAESRIANESRMNGGGKDLTASESEPQEKPQEEPEDRPMTEEERERIASAKSQQQEMEKALLEIESQAESQEQSSEKRQRLKTIANRLRQIIESRDENEQRLSAWQQITQLDQTHQILAAVRSGESIPDDQWNQLVSTLEDGLWQVRGKKPPEEYRKAIQNYQDSLRERVGP